MKMRMWWMSSVISGVVMVALAGAGVGCSDDDDGGDPAAVEMDAGGTVITNLVVTTNNDGSVSMVTNLTFKPNPTLPVVLKLAAPKLVSPSDGIEWGLVAGASGAGVQLKWEAVSGAEGYQLAYKRPTDGSFKTLNVDASPSFGVYPKGTNYWRVAALVNGTAQIWSETRSFIFTAH